MMGQLYKAARSGVEVQLLIRGICCIIPGRQGLSERIEIKRIVDRFLEHSRIFIFGTDEDKKVYIGSADWMSRNLFHRVEVVMPVDDQRLADELKDYFEIQWTDKVKAVKLDENLKQLRDQLPEEEIDTGPQEKIYAYLKNRQ